MESDFRNGVPLYQSEWDQIGKYIHVPKHYKKYKPSSAKGNLDSDNYRK